MQIYKKIVIGVFKVTTNNEMELYAAMYSFLMLFKFKVGIALYSDSEYLINGINIKVIYWSKKNFILQNKNKHISNKALWLRIVRFNNIYNTSWNWTKSHDGDYFNSGVDYLAKKQIKIFMKKIKP